MGRTQRTPDEPWSEIATDCAFFPDLAAALEAVGQSELGPRMAPIRQAGYVCRIHLHPLRTRHDPCIYLGWTKNHVLAWLYDGNAGYETCPPEACTPEQLIDLLRFLGPLVTKFDAGELARTWPHWPQTMQLAVEAPGPWLLEHLPTVARLRKKACLFCLDASYCLEGLNCDCAQVARDWLACRGDDWFFPDGDTLNRLAQLSKRACPQPQCQVRSFVGWFVNTVLGRTTCAPFLNSLIPQDPREWGWQWPSEDRTDAFLTLQRGRREKALRDVVGNPFRYPQLSPETRAWREGKISQLARSIYQDESFGDLPILADALEEAGAPDEIVIHCRSEGPHFRGCWALDVAAPELSARLAALLPDEKVS